MQSTSSALRNTHWLFIAVLSLLWLWQPGPARADFYGEAIPSTEVREYYYADDSGLIYRGGIALRDPLGVHARNAQLADLGLSADRDLCSMTGLWTNYQALFRQEVLEDVFIGLAGGLIGLLAGHLLSAAGSEYFNQTIGERINWLKIGFEEWGYLSLVIIMAFLAGMVPALKAYRAPVANNLVAE